MIVTYIIYRENKGRGEADAEGTVMKTHGGEVEGHVTLIQICTAKGN